MIRPLPGESFDSWLQAYAWRLRVSIGDLAAALAVPDRALHAPITQLLKHTYAEHAGSLVAATGLDRTLIDGLVAWSGDGAKALRWSRFCPLCLAVSRGRWQNRWRLPVVFGCLEHDLVLLDTCQACRQRQGMRRLPLGRPLQPGLCHAPNPDGACRVGRNPQLCGHHLGQRPEGAETLTSAQRRTQATILRLLETSDSGSAALLTDLIVVARHLTPAVALRDASDAARALTAAYEIVETSAGVAGLARSRLGRRPTALPASWQSASPALQARILRARDPHLRPTDRLRHATAVADTCLASPVAGPQQPGVLRSAHLSDTLWPSWAARLTPPTGVDPTRFADTAAVALLLPGSTLAWRKLADHFGPHHRRLGLSHTLTRVAAGPLGAAVLSGLTQLALGIDRCGSPIDYARRRRLTTTSDILDPGTWDAICATAGTPTGGHRKIGHARRYLYELLTGGSLRLAPHPYHLEAGAPVVSYHEFCLTLPPSAGQQLHEHARVLLDRHTIEEPLLWEPPISWVQIPDWPGAEPDTIDIGQVHQLLRQGVTPSETARQLGTTISHVRWIIRTHPVGHEPHPRSHGRKAARIPRTGTLTAVYISSRLDRGHSLRALAQETGHSRQTIMRTARDAGLVVPPSGGRPRFNVDAAWLHDQYVDRRRTLPDIAAGIGMSLTTLTRIAKNHGVSLRPRGGASHGAALNAPPELPAELGAALTGDAGHQRVRRFLTMAGHSSISAAAQANGIHQSVLSTQLATLERAVGGLLVHRRPRAGIQGLTPLGQRLRQQAEDHLR